MALNYLKQVKPLEDEGLTDAQIAERITSDPSRYSDQPLTVAQIASRLAGKGKDGAGITSRVMSAMDGVAETNRLVANKVRIADNGGTISLGNLLQRQLLQGFADAEIVSQEDVDALLALATVPDPVTAVNVDRCRVEYQAAQYVGRVHEAIATERDTAGYTASSIKTAVDAVEA